MIAGYVVRKRRTADKRIAAAPFTEPERTAWFVVPVDSYGHEIDDTPQYWWGEPLTFGPYWSYRDAVSEADYQTRRVRQAVSA